MPLRLQPVARVEPEKDDDDPGNQTGNGQEDKKAADDAPSLLAVLGLDPVVPVWSVSLNRAH